MSSLALSMVLRERYGTNRHDANDDVSSSSNENETTKMRDPGMNLHTIRRSWY